MRLLCFFGGLIVAISASAQAPAVKSPADIVPSTAFGFVSIRVSDLRDVEALKPIREALAKLEKTEGGLEKHLGMPLDEIDRLTLFWPAAPIGESSLIPYIVYTTRTPYNEAKLLKTTQAMTMQDAMRSSREFRHHDVEVAPGFPGIKSLPAPPSDVRPKDPLGPPPGKNDPKNQDSPPIPKAFGEEGSQVGDPPAKPVRGEPAAEDASSDGPDLFFRKNSVYSAIYLLDNRTILLMPMARDHSAGMLSFIGQLLRRKSDGPLADALAEAGKHTIVAAARVRPIQDWLQMEGRGEFPREMVPYRSLMKAQTVVVTANVAAKTTVTAKLTFADAATAKRAEPVLKTLIQNGIEAMTEMKKDKSKGAEWDAVLNPLLDLACVALEKSDVKADGQILTARTETEIGPAVTKAFASLPELIELANTKQKTLNNLKQIGLACHNYHDTMGHMPANIVGLDGKVLMSWRVNILPYIEQDNMYRQLDMTKAWDDPRNAKVLEKMPDLFRVFGREAPKGKTYLQMPFSPKFVPAGKVVPCGSPFLVPGRRTTMADIADGLSNTFMVVEAADAVNWAKPDDMLFDPKIAPKVGEQGRKWFYALFGDGSVRIIRRDKLTDNDLKAFLTIDGGEPVNRKD